MSLNAGPFPSPQEAAIFEVVVERDRQDKKWGAQRHLPDKWLTILIEEVGEAAEAILEHDPVEHLRSEVVQCAAVCVAWLEDLELTRRKSPPCIDHPDYHMKPIGQDGLLICSAPGCWSTNR